ncbi:flavodoxin family protein [Bryocella elongata]|nr:flavodoxin family protein [Bryocella elongata]
MARIAIVYHSGAGHTRKLAEAVERGVLAAGGQAVLLPVEAFNSDEPGPASQARWALLDASDAIIFGAPTYMGGVSAPFKAFLDATSQRWVRHAWKDKFAAGFTNSGNLSGDKLNTLTTIMLAAMQHGMIWISLGLHPPASDDLNGPGAETINRLGSFMGAMAQSSVMLVADLAPPAGDLRTGELLGERVAILTARFLGERK